MVDLQKYIIDKLETYISESDELKNLDIDVIPFYEDEEPTFPCIVVAQIENSPNLYSFSKETITDCSWQIEVKCQTMVINEETILHSNACKYIANYIANYMENELQFRRVTIMYPMPTDSENQIYSLFMRYRARHNLLTNTIKR